MKRFCDFSTKSPWALEMKIDIFTGTITFSGGSLWRKMSRAEFLESPIGKGARPLNVNEPFARYGFRPESGIAASAQFRGSHLEHVAFGFDLPNDSPENWTEQHELQRKSRHDDWLRREFGKPPYSFAWGEVASEFSARDCESDIAVIYKD